MTISTENTSTNSHSRIFGDTGEIRTRDVRVEALSFARGRALKSPARVLA